MELLQDWEIVVTARKVEIRVEIPTREILELVGSVIGDQRIKIYRVCPGSRLRRAIINIAWVVTIFPVIFNDNPCQFAVTKIFYDFAIMFYSITVIYIFYSSLFRIDDWFNSENSFP